MDPVRYTVDVTLMTPTKGPQLDIQYANPYLSLDGSGITFVPQIGDICFVSQVSNDYDRMFVLAFGTTSHAGEKARLSEPSYRSNRPIMNPGDVRLSSPAGNEVRVLNGGVVRIRSSGLAQRMYIPIDNLIRDFCERYHLRTIAGELMYDVDDAKEGKGHASRLLVTCRENTADEKPIGEILIGAQDDDLSMSMKFRANGAGEVVVKVEVDKNGNVTTTANETATMKGKKAVVHGTETVEVTAGNEATFTSDKHTIATNKYEMTCTTGTISCTTLSVGGQITLGDGLAEPAVKGSQFLTWASAITIAVNGLLLPPAPKVVPPLPTALSGTVKVA